MEATIPSRRVGVPLQGIEVTVTAGVDRGRKAASLDDGGITIGMAERNSLALSDPMVSRFHLELVRSGDRIWVIDHGSTNGTRIGPVFLRAGRVMITAGTTIEIGQSTLLVSDGRAVLVEPGP